MKVLFQSRKSLFTAPGGDTTQLLKTKEYLEKLGVTVDISLDLTPNLSSYDLVHLFNLMRPQELYLQVENAHKQNKPIALSTIYGLYAESYKKSAGNKLQWLYKILPFYTIEYLKVAARAVLNMEFHKGTIKYLLNGHLRLQKKLIKYIDVFLPNSHSEMSRVAKDMGLIDYKYVAVPNAVDVNKFDYNNTSINPEYEKYKDCILCVARIEGRKNQLNVIKACNSLPYQMVFIGQPGQNSVAYYEECKRIAGPNIHFLGQVKHEELPQFYKLAKVHVLASWMDTPGLSSLEAGIMHTNIVATKKGDPYDYFKEYAYYCEPDDIESIRSAIETAYNDPFREDLTRLISQNYKWEDTAKATLEGYKKALTNAK